MSRIAFKMKLKPGLGDEYKKRHEEIWPGMKELLINAGITDYQIFLDLETHIIFAIHNAEYNADLLKNEGVLKQWWEHMADIMEVNDDNSPVIVPLYEVFKFQV